MKKFLFTGLFFALAFVFVSETNAQTVTGSISNGSVTRGRTVTGYVVMNIPGDRHVNSNNPGDKYLIPTSVRISGAGVKLGRVRYPRGKYRKYSYSNKAISVYEGRVVFRFSVTVPKNFRGNRIRVRALVRYQPCTDEVCYAPRTKDITLTARVR